MGLNSVMSRNRAEQAMSGQGFCGVMIVLGVEYIHDKRMTPTPTCVALLHQFMLECIYHPKVADQTKAISMTYAGAKLQTTSN